MTLDKDDMVLAEKFLEALRSISDNLTLDGNGDEPNVTDLLYDVKHVLERICDKLNDIEISTEKMSRLPDDFKD